MVKNKRHIAFVYTCNSKINTEIFNSFCIRCLVCTLCSMLNAHMAIAFVVMICYYYYCIICEKWNSNGPNLINLSFNWVQWILDILNSQWKTFNHMPYTGDSEKSDWTLFRYCNKKKTNKTKEWIQFNLQFISSD